MLTDLRVSPGPKAILLELAGISWYTGCGNHLKELETGTEQVEGVCTIRSDLFLHTPVKPAKRSQERVHRLARRH